MFSSGGGSHDGSLTNGPMICHDCEELVAYFISSELHSFFLILAAVAFQEKIRPRGVSRCLKLCVSDVRKAGTQQICIF